MAVIGLVLRALNKVGLLRHLDLLVPLRMSGRTTRVPIMHGLGLFHVIPFEPFMDVLIDELVPLFPGVFLDVGVNLGQTLIKVKNRWPGVEYIGFEPNPCCVGYVERLIAANQYERVRLISAGLADHDGPGSLTLFSGASDDQGASLLGDLRTRTARAVEIPVRVVRWSAIESEERVTRLGVVKIDVEGGELEVLKELGGRLARDRPLVIVEVLPTGEPPIADRLRRQRALEALVVDADYLLYRIHKGENGLYLEERSCFGIHSDLNRTDHLLIPAERGADVVQRGFSYRAFK